jgi:hypothetical protein
VVALRRAARERGGPLPSIDVADALLDERRELMSGLQTATGIFAISRLSNRGSGYSAIGASGHVTNRNIT